jgi:hypothetical protein
MGRAALAGCHPEQQLRTLCGISLNGKNEAARVAAAIAILDRGWGKPEQFHKRTGTAPDGSHTFIVRHIHEGKPRGVK